MGKELNKEQLKKRIKELEEEVERLEEDKYYDNLEE